MSATLFPEVAPLRPLLKWPGGKGREWDEIAPCLPAHVRDLVDPFLGGGAPFARTPFARRALLNDRHPRLVALHRLVQTGDRGLLDAVATLGTAWDSLTDVAAALAPDFRRWVDLARAGERPEAAAVVDAARAATAPCDTPGAVEAIGASVHDKVRRLARLETRHSVSFDDAAVAEHCETAVRAGFYTFVREREGRAEGVGAAAVADFLFVRELCYGSMFRHNAEGAFNIPYGGTSYNSKSLRPRVTQYRAPETRAALARATFSCEDFEPFLARVGPSLGPDDLVFADPPYDSDFRSYGPTAFSRDDHLRLATSLAALPCPWILVIKETDFVRGTYLRPEMRALGAREVHAFAKQYGYNVRGRNERRTRHLLVANYEPPPRPSGPPTRTRTRTTRQGPTRSE